MKSLFRGIVLFALKLMAKKRLKKFNGKVIAVSGSVGKTSSKDAIFAVLNSQFKVKKSQKSMNSDFGLLLTILDIESGFSSPGKWLWFLSKAFIHSFIKDHSEVLLLELGVDKPGDMDFLTSIVKPDIVVLTNISTVHMADGQFKTLNDIFLEKSKLAHALSDDGVLIFNKDDEFLSRLEKELPKKRRLSFGLSRDADYCFDNPKISIEGSSFSIHHKSMHFALKTSAIGEYQALVLLPAIICGELMGIELDDILAALERFNLAPGRMTPIEARNGAIILDSSYNSSPIALREALKILKTLGAGKRKVAVLGSMNELGENSQKFHEKIGEIIPDFADMLLTVGPMAKHFAVSAKAAGMNDDNIFSFTNAHSAHEFFKEKIHENDIILVKGSQNNVQLESFVKALMKNPETAKETLVRQEKVWKNKS